MRWLRHLVLSVSVLLLCCTRPNLAWFQHESAAATFEQAGYRDKPILLKFDTQWCPYCARLDETVFRHPQVQRLTREFFCVRVDGDRASADELMARYRVQGFPTIIFARPDGEPLGAWQDLPDPARFATQLREILAERTTHASWAEYEHGTLPGAELLTDPYYERAVAFENDGDAQAAQREYRAGGFAGLSEIRRARRLHDVRSLLSPSILLLQRGGALAEAEGLAREAMTSFPDDFLYEHRLSGILRDQGAFAEAIRAGQRAFTKAFGRNRLWVGEQLAQILIARERAAEARQVITKALAAVDWEHNTRAKAKEVKARLEQLLAQILDPSS